MSAATAGTAEERAKAAIANILKCIIEMPHLCSGKERALAKRISPPRDVSLCAGPMLRSVFSHCVMLRRGIRGHFVSASSIA